MKNKNGFTLVELLAGIAIIGVFTLVFVYLANGTLANSLSYVGSITDNQVFEAAKDYAYEERIAFNDGYVCVTVNELVEYGYLDNRVDDKLKNKLVKITKNKNTNAIEKVNYTIMCD